MYSFNAVYFFRPPPPNQTYKIDVNHKEDHMVLKTTFIYLMGVFFCITCALCVLETCIKDYIWKKYVLFQQWKADGC